MTIVVNKFAPTSYLRQINHGPASSFVHIQQLWVNHLSKEEEWRNLPSVLAQDIVKDCDNAD